MTDNKIKMKDIAKYFNVTSMTIYRWKKEYKNIFQEHVKLWKTGDENKK